jgi:integrase
MDLNKQRRFNGQGGDRALDTLASILSDGDLFFLTAIFAGLRASELRGLRWCDIDFRKSELHVRQRAARYNRIGPPKSESCERTIPLPPAVALALREWKLACPKGDLDLVFPTSTGAIEHHTNTIKRHLFRDTTIRPNSYRIATATQARQRE